MLALTYTEFDLVLIISFGGAKCYEDRGKGYREQTRFGPPLLWRTPLLFRQDKVPTVDVLLPCCRENLDVVGDTIKAYIILGYPPNNFPIYTLINDKSIQVGGLVRELRRWGSRLTLLEIIYAARQRKHQWLKAVNLDFGLELARRSTQGAGKFVAVLDIIEAVPSSAQSKRESTS